MGLLEDDRARARQFPAEGHLEILLDTNMLSQRHMIPGSTDRALIINLHPFPPRSFLRRMAKATNQGLLRVIPGHCLRANPVSYTVLAPFLPDSRSPLIPDLSHLLADLRCRVKLFAFLL